MLAYLLFVIASLSILLYEIIAYNKDSIFKDVAEVKGDKPFVSIIVAMRNEAHNIPAFFHHISNVNYPQDKFEVLIGNDASVDGTAKLLKEYATSNTSVFTFTEKQTGQYGKLKVLQKLTKKAKGECLLFTDADAIVNPNWIMGMLYSKSENPKMLLGITTVTGDKWFHQLQHAEWLSNQTLISWITNHLGPVTAWGNNMALDKESYNQSGGFSVIKNSIVEDVDLMRNIEKSGGSVIIKAHPDTVVKTAPCESLNETLKQRLRWFKAAKSMPLYMKISLAVKMAFLPTTLLLATINPWVLLFFPIKSGLAYYITNITAQKIKEPLSFLPFLYYDLYEFVIYFMTFVLYLLPVKTKWKGRNYV